MWDQFQNLILSEVLISASPNKRAKARQNLFTHVRKAQDFHYKHTNDGKPTKEKRISEQKNDREREIEKERERYGTGSRSEREGRLRRDWKWDLSWCPRRPVFLLCQRVESSWSRAYSDLTLESLCNCRYSVSSPTSFVLLLLLLRRACLFLVVSVLDGWSASTPTIVGVILRKLHG